MVEAGSYLVRRYWCISIINTDRPKAEDSSLGLYEQVFPFDTRGGG
jgi:hypothetical protein